MPNATDFARTVTLLPPPTAGPAFPPFASPTNVTWAFGASISTTDPATTPLRTDTVPPADFSRSVAPPTTPATETLSFSNPVASTSVPASGASRVNRFARPTSFTRLPGPSDGKWNGSSA